MRALMVLFLAICLSLSPSVVFSRDVKKYTTEYNAYVLENLSKEIYTFIASVENLEDNWANRKQIMTKIFDIIDKYNCDGKLYVINRGLNVGTTDNKISHLLVTIFVMNSLEFLDTVVIKFDIASVKKGDPIKIQSDREKT
jgi:hypothetical protein